MAETDSDRRDSPTRILPEGSVLDLDDYLDMQSALADETQFRVLYALKRVGDGDASDLAGVLDVDEAHIESSLDDLESVGLAEQRMEKTPEMDEGEVRLYYRVSALGEGLLEEGIEELLRGEWDARERYS